ncbi:MAG: HD domain-containing protein [Myxococcota bacterium]
MGNEPIIIGAVDAGTNAIRVVISRAEGPGRIQRLHKERWPVRLGHQVFTHREFGQQTLDQAAEAFEHFRKLFDRFKVERVRAVATSATRESRNREKLLRRIQREADIDLEVISGEEEARLTRVAVQHAWEHDAPPELIVDIGGGSLELITLEQGRVIKSVSLPVGTVRVMETFGLYGEISVREAEMVERYVEALLADCFGERNTLPGRIAVGCGGNVEALAEITDADKKYGYLCLDLEELAEQLPSILEKDIHERMSAYSVRRDRAEVVGIAGIVLATLGRYTGIRELSAPDVGVREGVLLELSSEPFKSPLTALEHDHRDGIRDSAWSLARRCRVDEAHALHVREIALSIFDQLQPQHGLGQQERFVLELGALLHNVGYSVSRRKHHKHGEYIVKNAQVHGLDDRMRTMVACMVRHHRKSFPAKRHSSFSSLKKRDRRAVEKLAGILRIAVGMDAHEDQSVIGVDIEVQDGVARFVIDEDVPSELPVLGAKQRGHLFEVAFDLQPVFEHDHPVQRSLSLG